MFSRVVASLFLFAFLGAGLFFLALMWRDFSRNARSWLWKRTPCEIVSSRVQDAKQGRGGSSSRPYRLTVEYRYRFQQKDFVSHQFVLGHGDQFSSYSKASEVVARYPAGSNTVCYVNAASPDEAVLQRGSLAMLPFALIPLIFVGLGAGGIYFTWRRPRAGTTRTAPISERANPARGAAFLILFSGAFLGLGGVFLWMIALHPLLKSWQAREWKETPCRVISSEVRHHSDSDGTTYSVHMLFEYEVSGRTYRSDRYSFNTGSTSGYRGKAAIVRQFPAGKSAVCYVNPGNPNEAVIERGLTADLWFGLIPLVFVMIGLAGGTYGFKLWRNPSQSLGRTRALSSTLAPRSASVVAAGGPVDDAPRHLKPSAAPLGRLIASILIAAFWNGIVSVFVIEVVSGFQRGRPHWFLTLFMIPFVLIGIGMLCWVIYNLLALVNPRPQLTMTPGELRVGDSFSLDWHITGRVTALERIEIYLEGREEATYRRGTNTSTDKQVFLKVPVAKAKAFNDIRRGEAKATVPVGTMHTFTAPNNKIVWSLRVYGPIRWWPDVREEFRIIVHPAVVQPRPPL